MGKRKRKSASHFFMKVKEAETTIFSSFCSSENETLTRHLI